MNEPAQRTIRLLVEYDGTAYHGWQRQDGVPTIQQSVEEALARVLNGHVSIEGSSRTDAGVHAMGHASSFRTLRTVPCTGILRGTNSYLPDDIAVVACDEMPDEFHARFSATGKTYRYTIFNADIRSPRRHRFSHFEYRPLDADAMHTAAQLLVGTHDFFSVATLAKLKESTVRTITRAAVSRRAGDPAMIDIEFDGDGFLYNQVRTMAGTLLEVGLGRRTTGSITPLLQARDRKLAGPNLPACGLTLMAVYY